MKEIRAIVRTHRREKLREALRAIPNFPGATLCQVQGFTAPAVLGQRAPLDDLVDFTDKLMLCILCDDAMVEAIRDAILSAGQTGQIGDGLVWVTDVLQVHRLRDHQTP